MPLAVGISLAADLDRVHTFTLRGTAGMAALSVGAELSALDPSAFAAELTTAQLGAISIGSLSATAFGIRRTDRHIAADGLDVAHFQLVRLGSGWLQQDGRRSRLHPGTATFVRSAAAYHCVVGPSPASAPRSHVIHATVPMRMLPGRAADIRRITTAALPNTPLLVAATSFLATVSLGLPQPGSATADFVENAIIDLVLAVIAERTSEPLAPESAEAGTRVRIRDFVLRRLSDPALGPQQIAGEFGISTRYLHRLFETEETSVAAFIRRERLKKAAQELHDPGMRQLDLKAIATRNGFAGTDQFGRAFKSQYGTSPRDYRRTEISNTPPAGTDHKID
jgi:AraC-like DNA-binding protein